MDLGTTAKKLQRATKVAEESYKKMNELLERIQRLQEDLETTSRQVDQIERNVAEQRALIEVLAERQGVDTEQILEQADLPPAPEDPAESEPSKQATSRPSETGDNEA